MWHNMHGYWGWWWWIIGIGLMIFFIWMIVKAGSGNTKPPNSALDILNERYARGEISKDEYLEKKNDLTGR